MDGLKRITLERWRRIPKIQRYRYLLIASSCVAFLGPLAFLPRLVGNDDLCGRLCMRRFYLYYPGMGWEDLWLHVSVMWIGAIAFTLILLTTLCFGRLWCGWLCPVGGLSELGSRLLPDRWKIEWRFLPQVPIRYGYLTAYLVLLPALGVSACNLCSFIAAPRFVETLFGGERGIAYLLSAVGLTNIALLFLMGFFSSKGRFYCQTMCPIGAIDALVNKLGARYLRSAYRIRIDKSRCTGCNVCARNCMCGAIKMVNRVAVVDQFSCMSCHECVDVCDWNALEWIPAPKGRVPKRVKKGVVIHPEPQWQTLTVEEVLAESGTPTRRTPWTRRLLALFALFALTFLLVATLTAHGA